MVLHAPKWRFNELRELKMSHMQKTRSREQACPPRPFMGQLTMCAPKAVTCVTQLAKPHSRRHSMACPRIIGPSSEILICCHSVSPQWTAELVSELHQVRQAPRCLTRPWPLEPKEPHSPLTWPAPAFYTRGEGPAGLNCAQDHAVGTPEPGLVPSRPVTRLNWTWGKCSLTRTWDIPPRASVMSRLSYPRGLCS